MADWSKLPYDIIHKVSTYIETTEDFRAFSAVCSSWRSVHVAKQWRPGTQVPWLMLSDNGNIRSFLSLYRCKIYNSELPEAHGRRCWGSSLGWLVTIGRDLEMNLLNAVTRASISLPPITSLDANFGEILFWYQVIDKAFVFKKPQANEEDFLVVIIYGPLKQLAFCKPGNCSWKRVTDNKSHIGFMDATYFKDQLCAVTDTGTLVVIDIDDLQCPKIVQIGFPLFMWVWHPLFLVEISGDLWLIYNHVKSSFEPMKFFSFAFDFSVNRWMEFHDIGNYAVFIGDCCSMSVCAPERLNCKSNNIYFVVNEKEERWGYHIDCATGVYDLTSGITDPLFDEPDNWRYSSYPLWVMPTLH